MKNLAQLLSLFGVTHFRSMTGLQLEDYLADVLIERGSSVDHYLEEVLAYLGDSKNVEFSSAWELKGCRPESVLTSMHMW